MAKKNVREHFERLYNYDRYMDRYYLQRRLEKLKNILIEHDKNIKILDIGCGTGEVIGYINKLGYMNTFGLDISLTLSKISKNKVINSIMVADAISLPFKANEFDFVIISDVIEHLPKYKDCLLEAHRILKENGKLFITYPNPNIVPLLNFIASLGLKVDTRENRISLEEFENNIKGLFEIKKLETIVLASKLPNLILNVFERIEEKLPERVLNKIGFFHVLVLKREVKCDSREVSKE